MAAKPVHIFPSALEELKSAINWYMQRSPDAAQKFADEVDHSIGLVAANPKRWPGGEYSTRKLTLRRFPFAVVYRITTERIEIIAFAHGHAARILGGAPLTTKAV